MASPLTKELFLSGKPFRRTDESCKVLGIVQTAKFRYYTYDLIANIEYAGVNGEWVQLNQFVKICDDCFILYQEPFSFQNNFSDFEMVEA